MINVNSLSTKEIIRYAANGTIEAIPSEVFLSSLREYGDKIESTESDSCEAE